MTVIVCETKQFFFYIFYNVSKSLLFRLILTLHLTIRCSFLKATIFERRLFEILVDKKEMLVTRRLFEILVDKKEMVVTRRLFEILVDKKEMLVTSNFYLSYKISKSIFFFCKMEFKLFSILPCVITTI